MDSSAVATFVANSIDALLLMRYRDGDANVRSFWLCSRNDAIGNLGVLAAAVYATQSPWPDLIVAAQMGGLFLHSAVLILRQAYREMRQAKTDQGVESSCGLDRGGIGS